MHTGRLAVVDSAGRRLPSRRRKKMDRRPAASSPPPRLALPTRTVWKWAWPDPAQIASIRESSGGGKPACFILLDVREPPPPEPYVVYRTPAHTLCVPRWLGGYCDAAVHVQTWSARGAESQKLRQGRCVCSRCQSEERHRANAPARQARTWTLERRSARMDDEKKKKGRENQDEEPQRG